MGISCNIYIRKPQDGVHRAGQPVSGILNYVIEKPTEYATAILSLVGKAKCKWTVRRGKNSHTYTGKKVFLEKHLNILNRSPGNTMTLSAGAYEFPFEFILPNGIPSSFHDKHSHITYLLKAKFEKASFFSRTKKFKAQITVCGYVTSTVPAEPLTYRFQKKMLRLFSRTEHIVYVKVGIAKSFVKPGEAVTLDIFVTNSSDKEVYLTTKLRAKTTYVAEGTFSTRRKVVNETVAGFAYTTPIVLGYKSDNFPCTFPTRSSLYSIQNCDIISKEFYIRVTLHLPCLHRNVEKCIPIVIGEGRDGNSSEMVELQENSDTRLEPSSSDLPPPYWDVMNEDSRKK